MQKVKENANDVNLCSMIYPCMSLHDSLLDVFRKFFISKWIFSGMTKVDATRCWSIQLMYGHRLK